MSRHQVRIIGGQWKRTPLSILNAQGLRPTPDRVRETLFNWLEHLFDRQWQKVVCLDLFAGTGALGFEAASRGAAQITMVELIPEIARQLMLTQEKLHAAQINIVRGDALTFAHYLAAQIHTENKHFDLIFLDPPYQQGWLPRILPLCLPLLAKNGLVYAESEQALKPEWLVGWKIVRADKAGMVFYHLLERNLPYQA